MYPVQELSRAASWVRIASRGRAALDSYIRWYNDTRIKGSLGILKVEGEKNPSIYTGQQHDIEYPEAKSADRK